MRALLYGAVLAALAVPVALAADIGERHLVAHEASAAFRDAANRDYVNLTVWYPAAPDAAETPVDLVPPGQRVAGPLGPVADAPFIDGRRHATILLSPGFGGSAGSMAWFGMALARHGYIVVAVDHPGNNGREPTTVGGAVLFWERPRDLAAALAKVEDDAVAGGHVDRARIGVAGFSAGGLASLMTIGARIDLRHYGVFCAAHAADSFCAPEKVLGFTQAEADNFLAQPEIAREMLHAGGDMTIAGVKAAYVMAPALVQSLDFSTLRALHAPVRIILGAADRVAPPSTNGEQAGAAIPGANLRVLRGVGHYDFVADCAEAGDASLDVCATGVSRAETHGIVADDAIGFFDATLRGR